MYHHDPKKNRKSVNNLPPSKKGKNCLGVKRVNIAISETVKNWPRSKKCKYPLITASWIIAKHLNHHYRRHHHHHHHHNHHHHRHDNDHRDCKAKLMPAM